MTKRDDFPKTDPSEIEGKPSADWLDILSDASILLTEGLRLIGY
jgi:hypothetical protein